MKKIFRLGFVALAAITFNSCVNDLNVELKDPTMTAKLNVDQLLGKVYNTLGTTGQAGPDGAGDLTGFDNEGMSSFYRMTFALNEYPCDLIHWIWPDVGIASLRDASWNSQNEIVYCAYVRIYFDITLCNTFLDVVSESEKAKRAEVRFIRAFHYWYLLDLYGNVPFNLASSENVLQRGTQFPTEIQLPGSTETIQLHGEHSNYPHQIMREDLYKWLVAEVTDLEKDLMDYDTRMATAYYRVDKGAAWTLLSRLYLNSEVYAPKIAGTAEDYTQAAIYAKKVMDTYTLAPVYKHLFMADNDDRPGVNKAATEIVLPVNQDGAHTRSWGNSQFLIASLYTTGMPYWGTSDAWKCIRSREQLVKLFFPNQKTYALPADGGDRSIHNEELLAAIDEAYGPNKGIADTLVLRAHDDRAMFCNFNIYETTKKENGEIIVDTLIFSCNMGRNKTDAEDEFRSGWALQKFSNLCADPDRKTTDSQFPDTDLPLIRAAESYLTYAEAVIRGGEAQGKTPLEVVNELRNRAHAEPLPACELEDVLNEWGREFYCEGRRRVDLIRHELFTGDAYQWELKGMKKFGHNIEEFRSIYPIPNSDIVANPNLVQNDGY